MVKRIKAMKIKAVKKIGEDKYGQPKDYWWYPESNTIYDFQYKIPLAKISVDPITKMPFRQGENYIIGQIIQGIEI
jgi:hypothetical protein